MSRSPERDELHTTQAESHTAAGAAPRDDATDSSSSQQNSPRYAPRSRELPAQIRRFAIWAGVLYGVVAQLAVRTGFDEAKAAFAVMSFTFVFILPLCLGFLTIYLDELSPGSRGGWKRWAFLPWVTITLCLFTSLLVGWEGTICVVMAAPVYLPLASLGGVIAGLLQRRRERALVLLAPLIVMPLELNGWPLPDERREVITEISVAASPAEIWPEVTQVRRIEEEQTGFFYRMGFPKPIEATLSHEGVGGVREARFERGLTFYETVTEWVPEQKIRFTIRAAPDQVPLTTLDPHVVPGGLFFEALEGSYELLPEEAPGRTKIRLKSRYRLSTHFNAYASLWGDWLMNDIQMNILRVLARRVERGRRAELPVN